MLLFTSKINTAFITSVLQKEIYDVAVAHGFWDCFTEIKDLRYVAAIKLLLINTEVSEAVEELRNNQDHKQLLETLGEELADIVIRTLDLAEGLGIDLGTKILEKHEANKNRPHRHKKIF